MIIDKLKTKFSTGAFVADVKHYFSKINEIIDWINTFGQPSYKSYMAKLSQSGVNNPVATVTINELGGEVVWTRDEFNNGSYLGTLNGAFISGKTHVFTNGSYLGSDIEVNYYYDENSVQIRTSLDGGLTTVDDVLDETTIEIRVYN